MADLEKAITTQEQLDEVFKERLAREAKKYEGYLSPAEVEELKKTHATELETVGKNVQADKEKYEKEIAAKDAMIKGYETSSVKMRIALEAGLPYGMASRLTGETEEDIKKDAEALKAFMGGTEQPMASPEGDVTGKEADDAALKGMLKDLSF